MKFNAFALINEIAEVLEQVCSNISRNFFIYAEIFNKTCIKITSTQKGYLYMHLAYVWRVPALCNKRMGFPFSM